jgi:hypothetical protein
MALEAIPRKENQEIFESKQAYQTFLRSQKLGAKLPFFLLAAVILVLVLYITAFAVLTSKSTNSNNYASEVIYQNLIIGAIAQQARCIHEFYLETGGYTSNGAATLVQEFNNNLAYLQQIGLQGSAPFVLTVPVGTTKVTLLTSQYISTLINYASALSFTLGASNTTLQLKAALSATDAYTLQYLLSGLSAKDTMMGSLVAREAEIVGRISNHNNLQVIFITLGLFLLAVITVLLIYYLHHLNQERVKVFEIFLEISEPLIQQFSSKTERFLVALHSEESTDSL